MSLSQAWAQVSDDETSPSWTEQIYATAEGALRSRDDKDEEAAPTSEPELYASVEDAAIDAVRDMVTELGTEWVVLRSREVDEFSLAQAVARATGTRLEVVLNGLEWTLADNGEVMVPRWPPDHDRFACAATGDFDPKFIAGARCEMRDPGPYR